MFKWFLFLFLTSTLPHLLFSTRKILKELESKLLNLTKIQQEYMTKFLESDLESQEPIEYQSEVLKALLFLFELKKGINPIGQGSYGKVFEVVEKNDPITGQKDSFVVKEIFFGNDEDSEKGFKDQSRLLKEIKNMEDVTKLDPEHVFFPEFYSFIDATQEFKSEALKTENEEIKKHFFLNDDMDLALIFMEYLDLTLGDYYNMVLDKTVFSHFVTRLRIFVNITNGLKIILPKFSHCDLKPNNIMLKTISREQSAELVSKNHHALSLWPKHFYQIKIIDFGMTSIEGERGRRCPGGTANYQPYEFFEGNKDAKKIDIYAVALMMLDFELADVGIPGFNSLMGLCNLALKNYLKTDGDKLFKEYLDSKFQILQRNYLYKMLLDIWADVPSLKLFLKLLKKHLIPEIIDEIISKNHHKNLEEVALETLIYFNPDVMLCTFLALLKFILENYFLNSFVNSKIKLLVQNEEKYEQIIKANPGDPEKLQKAKEFKKYFNARVAVMDGLKDTKKQLLTYLYRIILSDENRPDLETFSSYLDQMLSQSTSQFKDQYEFIFQMEYHYSILGYHRFDSRRKSLAKQQKEAPEVNPFAEMIPSFRLII
jgi:serine/threonine protein kinase